MGPLAADTCKYPSKNLYTGSKWNCSENTLRSGFLGNTTLSYIFLLFVTEPPGNSPSD